MKLQFNLDVPDDIEEPKEVAAAITLTKEIWKDRGIDARLAVEDSYRQHDLYKMILNWMVIFDKKRK